MKKYVILVIWVLVTGILFSFWHNHFDNLTTRGVHAKQVVAVNKLKDLQNEFIVINVKDFGAIGDGINDDTYCIQKAIDSAREGQTVFFPCAKYLIGSIVLKSGIAYDFGNSELICSSDTPLTARGLVKEITTISDYKAFNKTVVLGSVVAAEKDDILHLIAFDDPFNTFRTYYRKGGTTPIIDKDVTKSYVEIAEPFLFNIKANKTTAKIVKPWRGKISNIKSCLFKQKKTLQYFIQINYGYRVKIENVSCSMDDGRNIIHFNCCCLCSLENCNLYKTKNHDIGYSYNVLLSACTRCAITNCNMKTMWHCYTNGEGAGCTVGTMIDKCSMLTDGKVPAFVEHSNGINTSITNTRMEGFVLSCGAIVKNCTLIEPHNFPNSNGNCFQLKGQHQNWFFNNYTLEDCTIHRTRDTADCVFMIKNEDISRNKTNKNRVYINNIKLVRCFAPDRGICKLLGAKNSNADINQISIENCRNISAEFADTRKGSDLGNRIKYVVLKDNIYKDKIANFKSNYVRNIVIDNCMIDNAVADTSILDIYSADNIILRNIKAFGLPVTLTVNIGAQNHTINNLNIENIGTKGNITVPTINVKFSPVAIVESAHITNSEIKDFYGFNIIKSLFISDCEYYD